MVIQDEAFIGTEKKYLIEIQSTGFDMDRDDFSIVLRRGTNKVEIPKSELIVEPYTITVDGQEVTKRNYYVVFDTRALGTGNVSITVTAHVPDTDFGDNVRDEVDKFDFLRIKSV